MLEFCLMLVLLRSCDLRRESRVSSVELLNDAYLWYHLCRRELKQCVYEKSFSCLTERVKVCKQVYCCCCHADFCMHLICCNSTPTYISLCDYGMRFSSLSEWCRWLKDISHDSSDMILIWLLSDDDYSLQLF